MFHSHVISIIMYFHMTVCSYSFNLGAQALLTEINCPIMPCMILAIDLRKELCQSSDLTMLHQLLYYILAYGS